MSIVIIGGHDRMVCEYKRICKDYNFKSKIFTQMPSNLRKQIGKPDLLVLFTNTVSHKMIQCALSKSDINKAELIRCHQSSGTALKKILDCKCCNTNKVN